MEIKTSGLNKAEFNAIILLAAAEARTPGQQLRRLVQEVAGLAPARPNLPTRQPARAGIRHVARDGRPVGHG